MTLLVVGIKKVLGPYGDHYAVRGNIGCPGAVLDWKATLLSSPREVSLSERQRPLLSCPWSIWEPQEGTITLGIETLSE